MKQDGKYFIVHIGKWHDVGNVDPVPSRSILSAVDDA